MEEMQIGSDGAPRPAPPPQAGPVWVSSPILDLRYAQTVLSSSLFSSARVSLTKTERTGTPFKVLGKNSRKGFVGGFRKRMTYPAMLGSRNGFAEEGFGKIRELDDIRAEDARCCSVNTAKIDPVKQDESQRPNPYWHRPPATVPPVDDCKYKKKLQHDYLHPLVSELQASENRKATLFQPNSALIASPNRRNPPAACRKVTSDSHAPAAPPDGDPAGAEALSVCKNYSTTGGLKRKEYYAPADLAQRQACTLTETAARAITSAIHASTPNNALLCNVAKAANSRITPNSGPKGTNSNRYIKKGLYDEANPVLPPSQAFRLLTPELQYLLRNRTNFTRSNIAAHLYETQVLVQPPPAEEPQATEEHEASMLSEPPEASENTSASSENNEDDDEEEEAPKPQKFVPKEPEEPQLQVVRVQPHTAPQFYGTRQDGELDESESEGEVTEEEVCNVTMLSLWKLAIQNGMLMPNVKVEAKEGYPPEAVTGGTPLRIVTPQVVSAFNNSSDRPMFGTYLSGVGLRMGDCMTQVRGSPKNGKQEKMTFKETLTAPSGAFAFDDSRFLALLTEKGTEVEQIYFEGMKWLPVEALSRIGDFCPELKLLNLDGCETLTDPALSNIAKKCSLLSYVNVNGCTAVTGDAIKAVIEHSHHLSILCCHSVPRLDVDGSTFEMLYRCRNLQVLDISYCEHVTDMSLVSVAQYCPGLVHLDLSGCYNIGDVGLRSVCGRCGFLQVLKLKLCTQPGLTTASLGCLTQAPRNLKQLDVGGVMQFTDAALLSVVQHAKSLQVLSIAGCVNITDASIRGINKYCKQLKMLNLSSCKGVSLASCMDLIFDVAPLSCLVVSESSISNAEVVMLQSLREGCRVIRNQHRTPPATGIWTAVEPAKRSERTKKAKKGK